MTQLQMQSPTLPEHHIKINHRGLTELVLACAFIALLTYALWSWQINGGHVTAMDTVSAEQHSAILPQILHHPAIILSAVLAEFILLLSVTLALVPPAWWLRADHIWGTEPSQSTTPLRWLGKKIQSGQNETYAPEDQYAVNAAGEPVYYEQPGMPGTAVNPYNMAPGQPMVAPGNQPQAAPYVMGPPVPGQRKPGQVQPGQPVQGQMQPGQVQPGQPVQGQMQPGQAQPGQPGPGQMQPGQAPPAQGQMQSGNILPQPVMGHAQPIPGQAATVIEGQYAPASHAEAQPPVMPPAPLAAVLNFEETPAEDDPLADLANIKDILTSAFDEDTGLDEDQAALGRSIEDFDIKTVQTTARQIMATFLQ